MKQHLKRVARYLATKPVIGRFVHIAAAIVRLPRLNVFLVQQLPQLLETVSEINHKQMRLDFDRSGFERTAPITLRQLTRDVADLRQALDGLRKATQTSALFADKSCLAKHDGVRLALGIFEHARGQVRIDCRPPRDADIVSVLDNLQLENATFEEISIAHFLERFSPDELMRSVLPRLLRLLRPGGQVKVTFLDAESLLHDHARGTVSFEDLRDAVFGRDESSAIHPRNMLSAANLARLLEDAGFVQVRVLSEPTKDGPAYARKIVAERGRGEL
ncbi:hypothetical protein [Variovorax sp. J22R115]|uniref:hypothetical protein n=1 Tax=Variovorax sp. J22R115 TaxID=3053509 RepID=UPI00257710C0|nr:hypothetical protein [Variovorax sp. J22R115]MDM0049026.1 hypothetical protein [Variovorax sp. J22R115]